MNTSQLTRLTPLWLDQPNEESLSLPDSEPVSWISVLGKFHSDMPFEEENAILMEINNLLAKKVLEISDEYKQLALDMGYQLVTKIGEIDKIKQVSQNFLHEGLKQIINNNDGTPLLLKKEVYEKIMAEARPSLQQRCSLTLFSANYSSDSDDFTNTSADEVLLWVHGTDESNKHFRVKEFLKKSNDTQVWIEPGQNPVDLLTNWTQAIQKLRPEWKKLPPNYLEELKKANNNYVFILQDVGLEHLNFVKHINDYVKCIVLSNQPLNPKSETYVFDEEKVKDLIEEKGGDPQLLQSFKHECYSANPLLLSIAIKAHSNHQEAFLDEWNQYAQKNINPSFVWFLLNFLGIEDEVLDELALLLNGKIDRNFFQSESLRKTIDILEENELIHVDSNFFSFPKEIQDELKKKVNKNFLDSQSNPSEKIEALASKFQKEVGHLFSEKNKWVIPHVKHLFKIHQAHCPDSLNFPLFCLMFAAGHLYTQIDDEQKIGPIAAKKISIQARNAIEHIVNKKYESDLPKGAKGVFANPDFSTLVSLMEGEDFHPHLAHLYINLQYQIGRTYFYIKDSHQTSTSKHILNYAKNLAEHLKYEGKRTLLLKQIDRNGLIFHLNEQEKYDQAIEGYENLRLPEEVFEVQYHKDSPILVDLATDNLFHIACLEYCLLNMIEKQSISTEKADTYVNELSKLCDNLEKPEQKTRPLLILVKVFLEKNEISKARELLDVLKKQKLTTLNELQVLESLLDCDFLEGKFVDAAQQAKKYRETAEAYYPTGYYAIYKYLHYEDESNCTKEEGFLSILGCPENDAQKKATWSYDEENNIVTIVGSDNLRKLRVKKDSFFSGLKIVTDTTFGKDKNKKISEASDKEVKKSIPLNNKVVKQISEVSIPCLSGKNKHMFSVDQNHLILGDRMYCHLSKKGELPELLEVLKNKEEFGNSKFGYAQGYYLKLESSREPSEEDKVREGFLEKIGENENKSDWGQFYDAYKKEKARFQKDNSLNALSISVDEVLEVARQIQQSDLFKCVGPVSLSELQKLSSFAENIHFRATSAFACHVMRHLNDGSDKTNTNQPKITIFFKSETDEGCRFELKEFESIASQYLENTRRLIKESLWKVERPNQKEDNIIDYIYYDCKETLTKEKETILKASEAIAYHKKELEALEQGETIQEISGAIAALEEKIKILDQKKSEAIAFHTNEIKKITMLEKNNNSDSADQKNNLNSLKEQKEKHKASIHSLKNNHENKEAIDLYQKDLNALKQHEIFKNITFHKAELEKLKKLKLKKTILDISQTIVLYKDKIKNLKLEKTNNSYLSNQKNDLEFLEEEIKSHKASLRSLETEQEKKLDEIITDMVVVSKNTTDETVNVHIKTYFSNKEVFLHKAADSIELRKSVG